MPVTDHLCRPASRRRERSGVAPGGAPAQAHGAAGKGALTIDLLYFANPMCSWCYGFHGGLEAALAASPDAFTVTVALGALRADQEPLRAEQKRYLRDAWTRVGDASGRPFDFALLERDDFAYDTRPACRAVAAVRGVASGRTLAYLGAVQTAFYRDNHDVTRAPVLAEIARETGLDPAVVTRALTDPAGEARLDGEYQETARLGIAGYPTLVALTRPRPTLVAHGYQPPGPLAAGLAALAGAPAPQ